MGYVYKASGESGLKWFKAGFSRQRTDGDWAKGYEALSFILGFRNFLKQSAKSFMVLQTCLSSN